jgi:CRISPR-associated endonuclease Csy4
MDHYLDIKVLPDPEFKETVLLNALFSKLHRALGQVAEGRVGVSFPDCKKFLGDRVRLHGSQVDLIKLMDTNWLQGLRDYCHQSEVKKIPDKVSYKVVRRVQAKSAHNKRKRSIAKGWISEAEAHQCIPDTQQKILKLPFLQIKSLSNGNSMRIYVEHSKELGNEVSGTFTSYGFSSTATIPWF